jgi:alkanesulfonate monooxygenase SsuD/methylene tetrahydromethanopterin reductase-like flavin-dependent oxidoreductase (luciferase family)
LAGSIEVGLMVEGQEGVTWPQWLNLAAAAEEHGFSGLYRSDHYLSERIGSNRDSLDAWGTICALSAVTSRIRLGTLVSPAGFRHPSVLAKLVVTADQVSGGRVELGMGSGSFEEEHLAYGFGFGAPRARMNLLGEQIEIIKRSWGPGPFSFSGEHYRLADLDAWPKPVQQPTPRLILGGNGGPRSIALAARWADEYNSSDPTDEQIRERRTSLAAECERIGRDPATVQFSIVTGVLVGADRRELEGRAVRTARFLGEGASDPATCLEGLPKPWLVGTPAEIVERLRTLESLGVDRIMLWAPLHDDLEMIALLGREVIPSLRSG